MQTRPSISPTRILSAFIAALLCAITIGQAMAQQGTPPAPTAAASIAAGSEPGGVPPQLQSVNQFSWYQQGPEPEGAPVMAWKTTIGARNQLSATLMVPYKQDLLLGTNDGNLLRIDRQTGEVSTVAQFGALTTFTTNLIVQGDVAYWTYRIGDNGSQVRAIDIESGQILWTSNAPSGSYIVFAGGDRVPQSPLITAHHFWIPGPTGDPTGNSSALVNTFWDLDPQTGGVLSSIPIPDGIRSYTVTDTHIIVQTANGWIQAIDANTGVEQWRIKSQTDYAVSLTVFADRLYFLRSGDLVSVSLITGRDDLITDHSCAGIRTYTAQVSCYSWPFGNVRGYSVSANGSVWYAIVENNGLYHAADESNVVEWTTLSGTPVMAPTVIDGMVFVATADGVVTAFGGDAGAQAVAPVSLAPGEGLEAGKNATLAAPEVLRGAPSATAVEILTLDQGETVELLEGPLDGAGSTWWYVRTSSGEEGFLPASSLVTILD